MRIGNTGTSAAIETKTLLEDDGKTRILPAYYSDNRVPLLPGESKELEIVSPKAAFKGGSQIGVRGWNVPGAVVRVGQREASRDCIEGLRPN